MERNVSTKDREPFDFINNDKPGGGKMGLVVIREGGFC